MKHFLYFLLVVFLFACSSNTIYDKPEDLIPKDTMELLLTDMYIASASKNVKNKFSKKKKSYLPLVYEKYKIDSTRFFDSNNYYTSKIEDYNEILTAVKNNIEAENTVFKAEFHIKDSIRKQEKKNKRQLRKEKDSLRKARKSKDYIPVILRELKIDSTRFYNPNNLYQNEIIEYNYIINAKNIVEEDLKDSEDIINKKKAKPTKKKSKQT